MMSLDMNRAGDELVKAAEYLAKEQKIAGRGIGAALVSAWAAGWH